MNSYNCTELNIEREREKEQWGQQVKPEKSKQDLWIILISISWLWYCTSFMLSWGEMVTGAGCLLLSTTACDFTIISVKI